MAPTALTAADPQTGAGRPLPKKESDIFRSVMKSYESKQYKKAVKQADTILKVFPRHGETLAMKGLALHNLQKPDEAQALVKLALQYDMLSPVCWHVYGLIHRSRHEYTQAVACYKQALRRDDSNLQIWRDLSWLQMQLRDTAGFLQTRLTILQRKPNMHVNWMAYAVGRQITGDNAGAVQVADRYLETLPSLQDPTKLTSNQRWEKSELALYKNELLPPDEAQTQIRQHNTVTSPILDRGAWLWRSAVTAWQSGQGSTEVLEPILEAWRRGATEEYRTHVLAMIAVLEWPPPLPHTNGDAGDTHSSPIHSDKPWESYRGTETVAGCHVLTEEQLKKLADAYDKWGPEFSDSIAMNRHIPLLLMATEEEFQERIVNNVCWPYLRKGVPSLADEMASFLWIDDDIPGRRYRPSDPVDIRGHKRYQWYCCTVDSWLESLESCQKFVAESDREETSATLGWTRYLRARLYEMAGEYMEGYTLLVGSGDSTDPDTTDVDVYELQARLLRSAGRLAEAIPWLQTACRLDPQDRYLNNRCISYVLEANDNREAEAWQMMGLFSRHEGSDVEHSVIDMQVSWFELALGACYERQGEYGKSLKQFASVTKHFDDFQEDQFDFHAYCLRKVTLRAYVGVLRYEDEVYNHEYFSEAAGGLIRIYLHLFDHPSVNETKEPDYSSMTAGERKRAKAIARKKKNSSVKKEAQRKQTPDQSNNKKKAANANGKPTTNDEDPFGLRLLELDPLEEAKKYSLVLARYSPQNMDTWAHQYDVAIRRKKPLLALQALCKAKALDAGDSRLFTRVVDFVGRHQEEQKEGVSPPAQLILAEQTPLLISPAASLSDYVESVVAKVRQDPHTSLRFRTAVARVMWKDGVPTEDVVSVLTTKWEESREISVQSCRDAVMLLKDMGVLPESGKEWIQMIGDRFPDAVA